MKVAQISQNDPTLADHQIAVIIPCLNESQAIQNVIRGFQLSLPTADIYVYDNGSTDDTVGRALACGAQVRSVPLRGKGHVVRRMFSDIEADVYVMVDGDDTYDANQAPQMAKMVLRDGIDMIVGHRLQDNTAGAFPAMHRFGNKFLTRFVGWLFDSRLDDMLSGYRCFSRRFVKSFPAESRGFEIETELTIHTLSMHLPMREMPTFYKDRAEGTESKLSTFKDGFKILRTIIRLLRHEKPLWLYGMSAIGLMTLSLVLAAPVILDFMNTGLVLRFPTAILSTGIMLSGIIALVTGLILDTVTAGRRESRKMFYLLAK